MLICPVQFKSFLYKESLDRHYVHLHKDKERYPGESDPEYMEYRFNPRPWPPETPYPGHEVCWYFLHPEDCGTSKELKEMLPVRIKGSNITRCTAFGIYVEERYTFWVVFVPAVVIVVITLGSTLWFLPVWLKEHPTDLQNATIPVMLAVSVVSIVSNIMVSLFVVRITNA